MAFSAGFDYVHCVPYAVPSGKPVLEALVEDAERLHAKGRFVSYEHGARLPRDAIATLRALTQMLRLKVQTSFDTRARLTRVFADACLSSTEPSLAQRYAGICLSLWRSHVAQRELEEPRAAGLVEWSRVRALVRNALVLSDANHRVVFAFSDKKRDNAFEDVVLAFARLFRNTARMSASEFDDQVDDVLSFVDPSGHTGVSTLAVLESLDALTPHADPQSAKIVPVLLGLWNLVPREVASRYILSNLARFVESSVWRGHPSPLTGEQLRVCFQGVLHALMIPLSAQGARPKRSKHLAQMMGLNAPAFAKLVVWSLAPDSLAALDLLEALLAAVESFAHPSNSGLWTALIMSLALSTAEEYAFRLNMEPELDVPASLRLNQEISEKFAALLLKPVFLGIFNPTPVVFNTASRACQHLVSIAPQLVVRELLAEFYTVLQQGFVHPQRCVAAISTLSLICPQLVATAEFRMHVTTLAELVLPSIDINEPARCVLGLAFFQRLASLTRFADISEPSTVQLAQDILPASVESLMLRAYSPPDKELAEAVAAGSTAGYPEICAAFMRRVFALLELAPDVGSDLAASFGRVLIACSDEIFGKLLDICMEEVTNPQQLSHATFSRVCGSFVRANCSAAFDKLFSLLVNSVKAEIEENQAGAARTLLPRDAALARYLSCLNMCLLGANSAAVLAKGAELQSLLALLRARTGLGIVYTLANTLHHAISALVGYTIILPGPDGQARFGTNLAIKRAESGFVWNVPTEKSQFLAAQLYADQLEHTKRISADPNSGDVTQTLTLLRTASGAIAPIADHILVTKYRDQALHLVSDLHARLTADDESHRKALLFLCKVLLCDVGYERTAKLDGDQSAQYNYEKRIFKVPGTHKRTLPPAVLARRAQLYHHQRLAAITEHRSPKSAEIQMLKEVVTDSCFSAYAGVKNNAFSTLHAALKIFDSDELYREIYEHILRMIELCLDAKDYKRVEGGFEVLKYGGLGRRTIAQYPHLFPTFLHLVQRAASEDSDNHALTSKVASLYFAIIPYALKLPVNSGTVDMHSTWPAFRTVLQNVTDVPLETLHWNEGLLRTATLFTLSELPNLPISGRVFTVLFDGLRSPTTHPDIKAGCLHSCLQIMHHAFRLALVGYDFNNYRADGPIEIPSGAIKSNDAELLVNDWSNLFSNLKAPPLAFKIDREKRRPYAHIMKPNSQGWVVLPKSGIWRAPLKVPTLKLTESDRAQLVEAMRWNTPDSWMQILDGWCVEPRKEDDKMLKVHAFLFRDLMIMSSLGFGAAVPDLLAALMTRTIDLSDKNEHRVLAELISGLLLSTTIAHDPSVTRTACELLNKATERLAPENIRYWRAMILLTCRSVDCRRLRPMLTLLFDNARPSNSESGGIKLALKVSLRIEMQLAIGWRKPMLTELVPQWNLWDFDLQTIREAAAEEMSAALMASVHPLRQKGTISYAYLNRPLRLDASVDARLGEIFETDKPKSDFSLLTFMLHSLQFLGGDPCLHFLLTHGMDLLLRCSIQRDDPELVVLVTKVFSELGTVGFSQASLSEAVRLLEPLISAPHWHQRIRLLLLTQAFFFNHLLIMSEEMRLQLGKMVTGALYDAQTEVRELASDTLSGMVRCSPPKEQRHYVDVLGEQFMRGLRVASKSVATRHACVLGTGALIGAFPYSSPPPKWVPEMLVMLAVKGASNNGIVGKSAQQVLSDFKKTRQDSWHVDKQAFTPEQLDDLEGVLWKNYYA